MTKLFKILSIAFLLQSLLVAKDLNNLTPDIQVAIKRCAECHGIRGEKSALHRSNIINKLSKETFMSRLNGYLKGTYGGKLKAFMRSRIAYLNKRQLTAIAEYFTSQNNKGNK